jgi:hypothetical protein
VTLLRTALLAAILLLGGCLTWVEPNDDDSSDDDDTSDDDDSGSDDDDTTGDDDDTTGDDDDSTADADSDGDGYTVEEGDCDDNNPAVNPGETEVCNSIDDNCDGFEDEGLPTSQFAPDADGDSYGSGNVDLWITACAAPEGYVQTGSGTADCADSDPEINPGATETCNGLDDDCDNSQDEGLLVNLYLDQDEDGWGAGTSAGFGCPGAGYSITSGDCDDYNSELNQDDADGDGLTSCDGDCEDNNQFIYPGTDYDGDGFYGCGTDCNDADSAINPQAAEVCNQLDDDCDSIVDDDLNSVVVIHGADLNNADAIATIADDGGWCVGPSIDVQDLWSVGALPYAAVIVTHDAGDSSGPYGDFNVVWSWYWSGGATGSYPGALIGMGAGGFAALVWMGQNSAFVWSNASLAASTAYIVRTPSQQAFTTPNPINPASGSVLNITNQSGAQTVLLSSDSNITSLAWGDQVLGNTSLAYASTAGGSGGRNQWLWGSDASFVQATPVGLQLLENVIQAAIGPP